MKTAKRDDIVKFCTDYLHVGEFKDHCTNGLQVEGKENVSKIVVGVSWSEKFVKHAIDEKADMVLVHHGFFANLIGESPQISIKGFVKTRLAQLLKNDISLMGFHLPLDAHPQIGNNASLCKLLGVKNLKKCSVGFVGTLEKSQTLKNFVSLVDKKLSVKSVVVAGGPNKVKNVAIISGGASSYFEIAKNLGADVFLCGDLKEPVVRGAEEIGINVINAGHYNTEKLGVQNLAKLITKRFGVETKFFDVSCDI